MKTGITNEELIARYYAGEDTRLELYNRCRKMIAQIARRVAMSFYCMQFKDKTGTRTAYTKQILEELRDEGMLEFFRVLDLRQYDPAKAKFSTYIVPFLEGAMRRWMEANLGCLSVSKDDMERIREVQRAYHIEGKSVSEIAAERGMTVEAVQRDLGYNTHFQPLSALTEDGNADSLPDALLVDDARSVDMTAYYNICVELLEPLFRELPERDRYILGSSFGAFGYEETEDEEIAMTLELTDEGLRTAKTAALGKLEALIPGSRLEKFRDIHRAVTKACIRGYDPDAFEDEGYNDSAKILILC